MTTTINNLVNRIPIGNDSPRVINAIIEIAKDTNAKYEYNEELDIFQLDRCLLSCMRYTCSYGFIPQTLGPDNDPLDVCVYNNVPIITGTLVEVSPIAALDMTDGGEKDYKIVAVPTSHVRKYKSLKELDKQWITMTENFFSHYKDLEGKEVTIDGWLSKKRTHEIIREGYKAWEALATSMCIPRA